MTTQSENVNANAASGPNFPQYQPPTQTNPHFVERKTSDPLFKLARFMMKPKTHLSKTPFKKPKGHREKKTKYY